MTSLAKLTNDVVVQLPTDGSGKKIRHLSVDLLADDGTTTTVYLPTMVVAGPDGSLAKVQDGYLEVRDVELRQAVEQLSLLMLDLTTAIRGLNRDSAFVDAMNADGGGTL